MQSLVPTLETCKLLKANGWLQGHPRNPWSDDYKVTYDYFVWSQPGSYRKSGKLDQWAIYDRETGFDHHEGIFPWFAAPTTDELADQLVEKHYQLRIEHDHHTMSWFAYFAGRENRNLFDNLADWDTQSATPVEALARLWIKSNQESIL